MLVSLWHRDRPSWCSLCLRGKTVLYHGKSMLARVIDGHTGEIRNDRSFSLKVSRQRHVVTPLEFLRLNDEG